MAYFLSSILRWLLIVISTVLATQKLLLVIILIKWGKLFNYILFYRITSRAVFVFHLTLVYIISAGSWVLPILFLNAILLAFLLGFIRTNGIGNKKGNNKGKGSLLGKAYLYIA
jgi:hypothetical protein